MDAIFIPKETIMTKRKVLALAVILMMALSAANIHAQESGDSQSAVSNHIAFGPGALVPIDGTGVTAGPGLQFSWYNSKLFGGFIGLGAHVGVFMPITKPLLSLAISGIVGATYTVFDNGTLAIPITAGFHFNYVKALYDKPDSIYADSALSAINLGLGVVSDFEWHFGERWYAYGRVAFALNFGAFEFLLMPGLGVGFSF
jgi:hypothetical protein